MGGYHRFFMSSTRTSLLQFVLLLVSAFASSHALAIDASANATVLMPISIAKNADLNFGNFFGALAGSVTVAPSSANTRTMDTVTAPTTSTGTVSAAKFTVTGNAGTTYSVTLPVTPATLTGPGAAMPIAAASFVAKLADGVTAPGTISSTTEVFYVGATLTVNAVQAAGAYTGTFSVAVAYN
jgi:hypothetical protein